MGGGESSCEIVGVASSEYRAARGLQPCVWYIVGFMDEETMLLSFLAIASETQYMTDSARVFPGGR
jgi:hypothetical protein